MRLIVLSDSHRNYDALRRVFCRHMDADLFIHLGDGEEELDLLLTQFPDLSARTWHVKGNCDYDSMSLPVLTLGLEHSRQATAAQSAVTDMTNQLLQKNADLLKMGTIETARESERSVVDIQTLQHTNQQLISTLDEVMKIQQEGSQKRKEAELELGRIEGELKQKLLELRG